MNRLHTTTRPRTASELRGELFIEAVTHVYANNLAEAQATLDEMAMVLNDEKIRAAKREGQRRAGQ